ncbi:hypothetical protein B0I35DRAFT_498380 [Stachybotrys elegans]|uniref:LysM domain-containing protein n=1 Tax=Stachybotrys elegans TaxID=80388 RepID=A0A8K0S8F5_9HYPO|nr:hypothetical protein B0I35DRAFT_498380 [Stachybotrys elegans]
MHPAFTITILAALASASVTSPIEGFEVQEASWAIEIEASKPPVIFNGTVEQVMAQLEVDYPETAALAVNNVLSVATASAKTSAIASNGLTKRDHTICLNFPRAEVRYIDDGINYLRGVPGRPWLPAGPRVCARVSCSYNAAIWWCNDNNWRVDLGSYSDIANAARLITDECKYFTYSAGWVTSGQRFHNDNLNVIVRGDSC